MNLPDAEQVHDSTWFDHAIRAGLVAYGVVHLVIAWLAAQLALGERSGSASNTGAMHELAQKPMGAVLVWLIAVGMALLVVWRLLEAAYGHSGVDDEKKRWRRRAVSALKAVLYGALGWTAVQVAMGESSGGGQESMTARLMNLPGGQLIVGVVGLSIIGYAGNLAYRGITKKFLEHLDGSGQTGNDGKAYVVFGVVGHVAKGVAIAIVGGLFTYAAVTHEAKKSGGLDQALQTLREQPFGPFLLLAVALGIGCYGLFCFARAKHLDR